MGRWIPAFSPPTPARQLIAETEEAEMPKVMILLVAASLAILTGCSRIKTEPGTETVIVENPWFFGHGGVDDVTQKPGAGWYAWSTSGVAISTAPVKYDEPFEHLATNDNNFINYASYVVLQWHDAAENAKKFGLSGWYENNLKEQYRTIVRDVTKKYQMTAIMTDPATLNKIESEVSEKFKAHIKSTGLHVQLLNVNMGKALPNPSVIAEMDATAVQQQRVKTETQRKLAEDSRLQAEKSRAAADNAYRESMHLDSSQFVQLESVKRYSDACLQSKSCVIVQGNAPVLVGH